MKKCSRMRTKWEAEIAIEKECSIIGVNLDGSRQVNESLCPPIIRDIGAIFIPFSPQIIKHAIENYKMHDSGNYHYKPEVYKQLGYDE